MSIFHSNVGLLLIEATLFICSISMLYLVVVRFILVVITFYTRNMSLGVIGGFIIISFASYLILNY